MAAAQSVIKAAVKKNVLLMTAGAREAIRLLPPLTVSESEVTQALEALEYGLGEAKKAAKK